MAIDQSQQQNSGGQSTMNFLKSIPGPIGQMADFKKNAKKYGKQYAQQMVQKMAQRIAKQVAQKIITSVAAFLAANPEIVAIIVAIAAVIIFFIIIFIAITGQSSPSTNGVSPQPGPPPPVQGQSLTCINGEYKTCLSDDFNIVVLNGSNDQLGKIFQSFAFAAQSSQYVSLLKSGGQLLKIELMNEAGCGAKTDGPSGLIQISSGCFSLIFPSYRYLLIHESGHIINARNRSLFYSFPWTDYKSQPPDSSCYDRGFLKSYALRSGVDVKDESFAESIADSLRPRSNSGIPPAQTINNFATECPATYSWFETNVFGGYTYF